MPAQVLVAVPRCQDRASQRWTGPQKGLSWALPVKLSAKQSSATCGHLELRRAQDARMRAGEQVGGTIFRNVLGVLPSHDPPSMAPAVLTDNQTRGPYVEGDHTVLS